MIYRNLHSSFLKFCTLQGGLPFVNFDSSWDEGELPRVDIIGTLGLSYEIDEHLVDGSIQIGISTLDDTNLFRLVNLVDSLANNLRPTVKIPIYDADSGVKLGSAVVKNGTRVMPVSGTKARPVQFVAINFATTVTYALP